MEDWAKETLLSYAKFVVILYLVVFSMMQYSIIDGFVKSLKRLLSVIPAEAGIQYFHIVRIFWIPVFTGMTTF